MDDLGGFLTFVGIVGLIVFGIIMICRWMVAEEFCQVAQEKGHIDRKYFWYTFLLGAVGCLLVIALPDRGAGTSATSGGGPRLSSPVSGFISGAMDIPKRGTHRKGEEK